MARVLPSADIKPLKVNITSTDVVFGKRSNHEKGVIQLEAYASNTCFSNGCSDYSTQVNVTCNPGTFVYQISGYTGSNSADGPYATRFDIVCSDGYTATVRREGKLLVL